MHRIKNRLTSLGVLFCRSVNRIENPIGEQFHVIVDKEPQ